MQSVNHVELASGRTRRLDAGSFNAMSLATVAPWLAAAIACREDLRLPSIELAGYVARAFAAPNICVVTICRASHDPCAQPVPVVTIAMANTEEAGLELWAKYLPTVPAERKAAELVRPAAPWGAADWHPESELHKPVVQEFAQALAWVWYAERALLAASSEVLTDEG